MRDVLNNARPVLLSIPVWRARVLLWVAAGVTGVAAVGFARAADESQLLFFWLQRHVSWWVWFAAPIGLGAISWLTRRYFPGAEGSGIPQTICALDNPATHAPSLLRLRVVLGRIALAAVGLMCGASIGREGPTVHVGAAITHAFGRWMPVRDSRVGTRALILAGGAAGVAAAFNTPLAGVVFGIEELSRSFEERASGTVLTAVILAGVAAIALSGNYAYFGEPHLYPDARVFSPAALFVALTAGLCGGVFSRVLLASSRGLPGFIGRLQKGHPVLFACACGAVIAALGWGSGGLTLGTGYEEARNVLEGGAWLPTWYAPARALATLASFLSGVPAGILAPSLSVGAGLGQLLGGWVGHGFDSGLAILGMCGYLAGVTQAPLTSFVIVMEMTTGHDMVLPLMLTAALATVASKLVSPPLYRTLADRLLGTTSRSSSAP